MLPQKNCLKKKKDFEKVFKKGERFKEGFLSLIALRNKSTESRFGFIVSRKLSKKATLRNKIKRRLRALAEANIPKINPKADLILIANSGLEKKDFWEIEEILKEILQKAKLTAS